MTDEAHRNAGVAIELLLEGENAECVLEPPLDQAHSPRPPRPELGADEIHIAHALPSQLARQSQVESWKIRQDGKRWLASRSLCYQAPHHPAKGRQPVQYLADPQNGDLGTVGHQFHAGLAHPRSAQAEQVDIGPLKQRRCQPRGVHLARRLSCGDQDLRRHHGSRLPVRYLRARRRPARHASDLVISRKGRARGCVSDRSSRIKRRGLCAAARARLTGARWPPETVAPRSATGTVPPPASDWTNSPRPTSATALSTAARSIPSVPRQTLDSSVPLNRNGSCNTMPKCCRSSCRLNLRMSMPSSRIWPRWMS